MMNKNKGFTIVELMVSMSLFLVLISVATGTFVQTLRTQRLITDLAYANDNATQALEQIIREVRTGSGFSGSTNTLLKFVNYKNETVNYKLTGHFISRCVGNCPTDSEYQPITAPEVQVERLSFIVSGTDPSDNLASRVTIALSVKGPRDIKVNLQSTVSSRFDQ